MAIELLLLLINSVRETPLKTNPILTYYANKRCVSMTEFSHKDYYNYYSKELSSFGFKTTGENLAKGYTKDKDIFNALQASPTHKANNESKDFKSIGIAKCKNKIGTMTVILFGN